MSTPKRLETPVGRVVSLSADLFNGPDPVPGIEVELPLEQVKAITIGAKVALVAPADLAALCDEVEALRAAHDWYRDRHNDAAAALAAKDAENERLRAALKSAIDIVDATDDVDILALDALDALLAALADGEATG